MKILISAAEASSDAHGAELLHALKEQASRQGIEIEALGVGGPKLQAQGLRAIVDARDLLAMGFTEILGRLPKILRALKQVAQTAEREKPRVAVFLDYPDFHFRLARRLHAFGVPLVYYIPPKVWAWRTGRVKVLKKLFKKILCILPFEEPFYRQHQLDAVYVGNPLLDELPLKLTRAEARQKLGLAQDALTLLLMPGSRPSELKQHLRMMCEAALIAAKGLGGKKLHVLLPLPMTADLNSLKAQVSDLLGNPQVEWRVSQGDSALAMVAADAGLIKSGTSTLEAAVLGCPHAVVYRVHWLSYLIVKYLVRYRGPVGLVNLVAGCKPGGPYLAEEWLGPSVNAEVLASEAKSLLTDESRRARMRQGLSELRAKVEAGAQGQSPSVRAAQEILQLLTDGAKS